MRLFFNVVWKLALSAGISLGLVLLLLRLTGAQAATNLPAVLRNTLMSGIAAYVGLHLVGIWLRAIRFQMLIAAGSTVPPPRFVPVLLVSAVRNMAVDMLPARLGELAYVALMNRGCRVSGDRCVSSLSLSFAFDMLALVVLLIALAGLEVLTGTDSRFPLGSLLIGLSIPVALFTAALFGGIRPGVTLIQGLFRRLAATRLVHAVLQFLLRLADAIAAAARAGIVLRVLGLSVLVRLAKYAGLFLLYRAVTGPSFAELQEANFLQVLLALIGGEAGAALALPTLMGFGAYEAGAVVALAWSGFSSASATVAMLALHLWSQAVDYAIGGLALIAFLFFAPTAAQTWAAYPRLRRVVFVIALAGLMATLAAGGWWHARAVRLAGAVVAPPAGVSAAAQEALRPALALVAPLRGFITWSSNRDGNHNLYRMALPDLTITRITDHPHPENIVRLSPDGTRVAFMRSQEPWVSLRNDLQWDVVVRDLASGVERVVAQGGHAPSWAADGQSLVFIRNGSAAVIHHLDTGMETEFYRASPGVQLQTPALDSTASRLAVSVRGPGQYTAVIDSDGSKLKIAGGCQIAWGPDDAYLYHVDKGGRDRNAFYRAAPDGSDRRFWLDLPEPNSHEYFPRVSADGAWIVFASAASGHEHDTEDYELFLWKIGTPAEAAVQLTFHTGNDSWPDIYLER